MKNPLSIITESTLFRNPLFYIVLFASILYLMGIDWGLPNSDTWQSDSLAPFYPLLALSKGFSGGYAHKYPLVHQFILAILYIPALIVAFIQSNPFDGFALTKLLLAIRSTEFATTFIVIARLVSVTMALILIVYIYKSVKELFDEKIALVSACIMALNPVINANAHVAKVDLPYLFWAVISLYYLVRIIKYDETRDYIWCAIFATIAIGTKDQAYALFIIPFLFYLFFYYKRFIVPHISFGMIFIRRKILIFSGAFLAGIIIVENLLLNWSGFVKRFLLLTGDNSSRAVGYSYSISGIFALLFDHLKEIAISSMGLPIFIISIIGMVLLIRQKIDLKDKLAKLIFLFASLSFYLFFVQVIRQDNVRFALPQSVFFSVYAAFALVYFHTYIQSQYKKWLKYFYAVMIILILYSLYLTVSINMNYLLDMRYTVEKWMKKHVPKDATIEYYSYPHYIPRLESYTTYRIKKNVLDIESRKPDYILLSSHYYRRYRINIKKIKKGEITAKKKTRFEQSGFPLFFFKLFSNSLSYRLVFRHDHMFSFFKKIDYARVSPDHILIFKRVNINALKNTSLSKQSAIPLIKKYINSKMKLKTFVISNHSITSWKYPDLVAYSSDTQSSQSLTTSLVDIKNKKSSVHFTSFTYINELQNNNVREKFFTVLSNSSWAERSYLICAQLSLDISHYYDLKKLSTDYGVGVIILNPKNLNQTDIVLPAKNKRIDWESVENLYNNNKNFKKLLNAINKKQQ